MWVATGERERFCCIHIGKSIRIVVSQGPRSAARAKPSSTMGEIAPETSLITQTGSNPVPLLRKTLLTRCNTSQERFTFQVHAIRVRSALWASGHEAAKSVDHTAGPETHCLGASLMPSQTTPVHGQDHQPRRNHRDPDRTHRRHRHHSYGCIGRYAPPQPPPRTTLLWRRSYASSPRVRRLWHDTRREDYEQQPQSVRAVRGRSPRSRGVGTVAVVGGAQLDTYSPGCYQTTMASCVGGMGSSGRSAQIPSPASSAARILAPAVVKLAQIKARPIQNSVLTLLKAQSANSGAFGSLGLASAL